MPSELQHKEKYAENRKLLDNELNIENEKYYNWISTVAFYAAMHLIEGKLANDDIHNKTHLDRGNVVERYSYFRNIRTQYKTLHDRSIVARYGKSSVNKKKAEQALKCLEEIEKEINIEV